MKILTLDTALNKTYISLNEDETVIENSIIENSKDKYHSAFLIQQTANILKNNNLKMENINAIGINIGPGSFTGIRACTTVGRVIAQQINALLIGVSSLEILSKINNNNSKTLVTLDARKNSAYAAIYHNEFEIEPPHILKLEELYEKSKNLTVISDKSMHEKLQEKNIKTINYEEGNYPLNEYLAKIVFERLCSSNTSTYNWARVKPLYIQPPSIFGK